MVTLSKTKHPGSIDQSHGVYLYKDMSDVTGAQKSYLSHSADPRYS